MTDSKHSETIETARDWLLSFQGRDKNDAPLSNQWRHNEIAKLAALAVLELRDLNQNLLRIAEVMEERET